MNILVKNKNLVRVHSWTTWTVEGGWFIQITFLLHKPDLVKVSMRGTKNTKKIWPCGLWMTPKGGKHKKYPSHPVKQNICYFTWSRMKYINTDSSKMLDIFPKLLDLDACQGCQMINLKKVILTFHNTFKGDLNFYTSLKKFNIF